MSGHLMGDFDDTNPSCSVSLSFRWHQETWKWRWEYPILGNGRFAPKISGFELEDGLERDGRQFFRVLTCTRYASQRHCRFWALEQNLTWKNMRPPFFLYLGDESLFLIVNFCRVCCLFGISVQLIVWDGQWATNPSLRGHNLFPDGVSTLVATRSATKTDF